MNNLNYLKRTMQIFALTVLCGFTSNLYSQTSVITNFDFNTHPTSPTMPAPISIVSGVDCSITCTESAIYYTGVASGTSAFIANVTSGDALVVQNPTVSSTPSWVYKLSGSEVVNYKSYILYLQTKRSSTGPQKITYSYSSDGVTFTDFVQKTVTESFTEHIVDLSSIVAIDNKATIYLKLTMTGATAGNGTIRTDNVQIQAVKGTTPNTSPDGVINYLNGNVGIGVTEPQAKLHISGDVIMEQLPDMSNDDNAKSIVTDASGKLGTRGVCDDITCTGNGIIVFGKGAAKKVTIGKLPSYTANMWASNFMGNNIKFNESTSLWELETNGYDNGGNAIVNSLSGDMRFISIPSLHNGIIQTFNDEQMFNQTKMIINRAGSVGIGILSPSSSYKLSVGGDTRIYGILSCDGAKVNGIVNCEEIKVEVDVIPDYVFEADYKLMPLSEIEQFVKLHKHLPEVPSEKEFQETGMNIGDMNALLLKKIEELTLYLIELQKENEAIKTQLNLK